MQITQNAVVTFHYALINDQGEVIDGTKGGDPIPYLHGHKNIVPGLESALEGKSTGDHFKVMLTAAQAYGDYDEDKVFFI
ncbi:FKBP-type peptidyl-prolyl cis-trans isomerase [Marivivens sp.]|uniref:FKBP-type peptidyl-prolyl cis-trans isomerase n=1 Tax=Marivivens sp. TaxID=1978374 RepID=UPI0025BD0BC2|nr:FKBP-type peptidyl-prolyl cis-trans isomerase [Marivivens sp.]